VNLHIVFFGMAPRAAGEPLSEEERAREQFRLLTEESRFNTRKPPRTPARILAERDAERLARYCYDALLPRFPYRSVTDAGDRAKLDPTLPGDGGIKVSPALPPENYKLWGTRDQESRQTLELRPGARVMLEARRGKDSEFTFVLPAYGLDVAKKKHAVFAEDNGMYAMIPAARLATPPEGAELKLILGMEPTGERKPADLLEVARPRGDFVWFEVAGPDGKPAPVLRVENRWHVWAPTWDLTATRWDAAKVDSSSVRRPAVTGYWLGGFPASPVEFTVKSKRLDESLSALQDKTYRVGDSEVKVVGIDAENYDPDNSNVQGIPKGKYLTIRIQSTKPGDRDAPGERVFLHPPAWKGNDRPWLLHQHHAYYDAHGRYTARFGPITDNDPDETITFALYSVEDLKKSSRAVTVKLPDGPLPSGKDVMDDLTRPPLK
jgi:hypothetical protein